MTKCEVTSPALEKEIKDDLKNDGLGIILKPKQEIIAKSAAQIVNEQRAKYVFSGLPGSLTSPCCCAFDARCYS